MYAKNKLGFGELMERSFSALQLVPDRGMRGRSSAFGIRSIGRRAFESVSRRSRPPKAIAAAAVDR